MAINRRKDIRGILAHPDLRRELMVPTLQATQAREGIETSREQAERAYYVVTEGEQAAFFSLRPPVCDLEEREEMFVKSLHGDERAACVRFDVARRDFGVLESAPLVFTQVAIIAPSFRDHPALGGRWADVRGGMNSTESDRFVRYSWEPSPISKRRWVKYSKGGSYARFYSDLELVFDWTDDGFEFRQIVRRRYGSESRFVKSPEFYFRRGLTWTEKSSLGLSVRLLHEGAIFNVAGPAAFPREPQDEWFLLGVMNSGFVAYIAWALSGRNYGASYVAALPIPSADERYRGRISTIAQAIHDAKAAWDEGNEVSTCFHKLWIFNDRYVGDLGTMAVPQRLDRLLDYEAAEEAHIQELYAKLDDDGYKIYSIADATRAIVEETIGARPPEILWPQMEGKGVEQKRMEHVFRLLSYAVKRVVHADEDGIVPFAPVAGESCLLERVHQELQTLFPQHDIGQIEVEIANELKKEVKGYRRTSGIREWLENVFFEYHCALYKNRPILWHIASSQGTTRCAFGALCLYHKLDRNRLAKLRAQYLRDAIEGFRREAAIASKAGRTDDRIEWQARLEEAQDLDFRLQFVQEGHHEGPEGGERDYRILTPWKSEDERPKGWDPDLDDGVKINIEPLQKAGVLRVAKVVS